MTDISFSSAVAAYKAAATHAGDILPQTPEASQAAAGQSSSFAAMLRDAVETSQETVRQGEMMSIKVIAGDADRRDVVLAVNNAELTLQTVVSVRDKVISAYDTIMRMPL